MKLNRLMPNRRTLNSRVTQIVLLCLLMPALPAQITEEQIRNADS